MEPLLPQGSLPSLHGVPFDQKWDLLKPTIERLYVEENMKLRGVINTIKDWCGFDAAESQYKYRIKEWKLKKSTSTSKKKEIIQVLQKRAQLGKSSAIKRGDQDFDTKNLRRYLKTERRKSIALQPGADEAAPDTSILSGRITLSNSMIFMNWNMPYAALRSSAAGAVDHVSPLSDIVVATPQSPREAPSPMAVAVREMTAIERARLFAQGKHVEALKTIEYPQRVTLSTWMYQYWFFAFKSAKHWGRGPQDWTASILRFDEYRPRTTMTISSPNTPASSTSTPTSKPTPRKDGVFESPPVTSLCRWSIHCENLDYDPLPSPPRSLTETFDLDDEEHWPTWPDFHDSKKYTEKLNYSLESNNFSNVKPEDMPISVGHIAEAAKRSPDELLEEALGFSIMSRNWDLFNDLLLRTKCRRDRAALYPLHLAVSYLDGSKTCCNILSSLVLRVPSKLFTNGLGHTVLDQLMIAILKSHSSCSPSVVDSTFQKSDRFEGEYIDICGRWDADSDCVRALLANGTSRIPFDWKHMFCHTSVQAICHCIIYSSWVVGINNPSGLFVRRCLHCGLKMQPLPLHTLVLVGLHLSRSGCKDETLFGILACLLCLLSRGANPLRKTNVSVQALLGNDEANECDHEELDPVELLERVPFSINTSWSKEVSTCWSVVCNVLWHSQAEWNGEPSKRRSAASENGNDDEMEIDINLSEDETSIEDQMSTDERTSHEYQLPVDCDIDKDHETWFGKSNVLASLWAAVQTELLSYRRLKEGDEWISHNFNMETLHKGLVSKGEADIALVRNKMMKPFCRCGMFVEDDTRPAIADDALAFYFSNLDDWNRSTFIETIE